MAVGDSESCGSREMESSTVDSRQGRKKLGVYNEVLRRLREADHPGAQDPAFDYQLRAHFNRLPSRYAIDVNLERAGDVLTHKRLLHLARDPENRPAFEVRLVQVVPIPEGNLGDSINLQSPRRGSIHPPPAFGSSSYLDALAHEASKSGVQDTDSVADSAAKFPRPMHEITFSTVDKPKLLSQLTSLLAEVGLNIQEAHAFSTVDGYSLDVFVVDGWPFEEVEQLQSVLRQEILKIEKYSGPRPHCLIPVKLEQIEVKHDLDYLRIPVDGTDVWEIDPRFLKFESKLASGSSVDLYKGTYCSQEVAIKVLNDECLNTELQREFAQEVYIMRKVRHRNVVRFIGACTRPTNVCIVTEYMSRGSIYDYLQRGTFNLPALLKVAIDVSKGMDYLHQNNIIHRDLKAANLLMDENEVVKVADFGVARVKSQTGVMTAETGTYRWMAPEVIEHKPYNHKADVFSFGVVLWELLTAKLPHENLTPLQAAVGVVQRGLRPTIPDGTHPKLGNLVRRCWQQDPTLRPDFSEITQALQQTAKEVEDGEGRKPEKICGSTFSGLGRRCH